MPDLEIAAPITCPAAFPWYRCFSVRMVMSADSYYHYLMQIPVWYTNDLPTLQIETAVTANFLFNLALYSTVSVRCRWGNP